MKKVILMLSLMLTVSATGIFASEPNPVSEEIKAAFKKEFPGAELITWSNAGTFLKAIFIYSGYRSEAYFNEEGELQGSARNIFYSQLPLAVTKAVEKRFENPDVMEVSEITINNGTRYLLRLEAGNKTYKTQLDAGGNFINVERQKK